MCISYFVPSMSISFYEGLPGIEVYTLERFIFHVLFLCQFYFVTVVALQCAVSFFSLVVYGRNSVYQAPNKYIRHSTKFKPGIHPVTVSLVTVL